MHVSRIRSCWFLATGRFHFVMLLNGPNGFKTRIIKSIFKRCLNVFIVSFRGFSLVFHRKRQSLVIRVYIRDFTVTAGLLQTVFTDSALKK